MKKNYSILCVAVLALVGAMMSCSKEESIVESEQFSNTENTVTFTTTIGFDGVSATRALNMSGKKTFAVGETIAVIYKNASNETMKAESNALTAKDIFNDGENASFTVTMEAPKESSDIRYVYPASMAKETVETSSTINDDAATININALSIQDGTLAGISHSLDLAVFDGALTAAGKLPTQVDLTNKLAICKFIVNEASDITGSVTSFYVENGTNKYYISRTAAAGFIYVAMLPVTSGSINFSASTGTAYYEKTVSGKTLDADNLYPISVTLARKTTVSLAKISTAYTAQDGETLTGELNTTICPVKISIASGATVTLNGVTINGVDHYEWAGISCEGNAILILKDGSTNTVSGFKGDYPGIYVPEGSALTIQGETAGTGSLTALCNSYGNSAGIGAGPGHDCGDIIIEGGVIVATGGAHAPGIGSSEDSSCGTITIANTVTSVTVNKGSEAPYSIGKGASGTCGTVTIGGFVYWNEGKLQNSGNTYLAVSPFSYPKPAPTGAVVGRFAINDKGAQVYFAKGNLQATYDGSSWSWAFAANQWSFNNSPGNAYYDKLPYNVAYGPYDLFCWVGKSSVREGATQMPGKYGLFNSFDDVDFGYTTKDVLKYSWGETIGSGWEVLTADELSYLLNERSASTVGGVANGRYAKAYLFGTVHGIILFPDSYTHPAGVAAPTGVNAIGSTSWNANKYNATDWARMETAGAVFLPAAGFKYQGGGVDGVGAVGDYWTSTPSSTSGSHAIVWEFNENNNYTGGLVRKRGSSVRLVYKVN